MFALDAVVMIHKRGAIVSRSWENKSSSRKMVKSCVLLSESRGWPGKATCCEDPDVRLGVSSVVFENGGILNRCIGKAIRYAGEVLMKFDHAKA